MAINKTITIKLSKAQVQFLYDITTNAYKDTEGGGYILLGDKNKVYNYQLEKLKDKLEKAIHEIRENYGDEQ